MRGAARPVTTGGATVGYRSRALLTAASTGLLVLGSVGAGASAGALPLDVTFDVTESSCVHGISNKGGITIQLRSGSGDLLDTAAAWPGSPGAFEACFDRDVRTGHRLRAVLGGDSVSWTIPVLTVKPNRASDVVAGRGPRRKHIRVLLYDCAWNASPECVWKVTRTLTVRSDGTWSRDFTSLFDARGFDRARVVYESGSGHTFTVERPFPWLRAILDAQDGRDDPYDLAGASFAGLTRTFTLRSSPGGSVLATRHAAGETPSGKFWIDFGRVIRPGQQFTASFADDARLTVWPIETTVTFKAGGQVINGWCLPDRYMTIDWFDGARRIRADHTGKASVHLDVEEHPGFRLDDGVMMSVSCQNSRGDVVLRWMRYRDPALE